MFHIWSESLAFLRLPSAFVVVGGSKDFGKEKRGTGGKAIRKWAIGGGDRGDGMGARGAARRQNGPAVSASVQDHSNNTISTTTQIAISNLSRSQPEDEPGCSSSSKYHSFAFKDMEPLTNYQKRWNRILFSTITDSVLNRSLDQLWSRD